jgi:hypothetical protein
VNDIELLKRVSPHIEIESALINREFQQFRNKNGLLADLNATTDALPLSSTSSSTQTMPPAADSPS